MPKAFCTNYGRITSNIILISYAIFSYSRMSLTLIQSIKKTFFNIFTIFGEHVILNREGWNRNKIMTPALTIHTSTTNVGNINVPEKIIFTSHVECILSYTL